MLQNIIIATLDKKTVLIRVNPWEKHPRKKKTEICMVKETLS